MRYTTRPSGSSPGMSSLISSDASIRGGVPSSALSTLSIDPPSPVSPILDRHIEGGEFVFPPPYRCTINGWASLIEFVPYSASQPQQIVVSSATSSQAQNYSLWRPGAGSTFAHSSTNGDASTMHVAVPFRLLMSPYDMSRVERAPFFRNQSLLGGNANNMGTVYSRSLHSRAGGVFPSSISTVLSSDQGTRQRLRSVAGSTGSTVSTHVSVSPSHSDILQQRAAQRQGQGYGFEWQDAQNSNNSTFKGANENSSSSSASFGGSAHTMSSSNSPFLSNRSSNSLPTISSSAVSTSTNNHRTDLTHQNSGSYSGSALSRTSLSSLQQPSISSYSQQQLLSPRVTTRGQGGSNLIFSTPRSIGHAGTALMSSSSSVSPQSNRPYSPTLPPYSGTLSPRGATQQQQRRGTSGALGSSPFLSPYASSYASRDLRSRASPTSRGRWDE